MTDTEWFVLVDLGTVVDSEQARALAAWLDDVEPRPEEGITRTCTHIPAWTARHAINQTLDRVAAAVGKLDLDAEVERVDATTALRREADLASGSDVPGLVGVAEIGVILSVRSRQQVGQLAQRPDFPSPVAELRAGRVWRREDVEAFGRRWAATRRARSTSAG